MADVLPPMSGVAPALTCSRVGCKRDATTHVIWDRELRNGLCCNEHVAEARERWSFWAMHPYDLVCSAPNAMFIEDQNRCTSPVEQDAIRRVTGSAVSP
jgi:hypothetical protein